MQNMKPIILDACVAAKLFIQEHDSPDALELIRSCFDANIPIIAPDLLKYELVQVAIKKQCTLGDVLQLFDESIFKLIVTKEPDRFVWLQAEQICQKGHQKSGYPTIYDSVYHAMAIIQDGIFITSDKRHYEKAKSFGHISLLSNWQKTIKSL